MISSRPIFLFLAIVVAVATAFAPTSDQSGKWSAKTSTYAPMKRVNGFASPPPSSYNRMNNRCNTNNNGVCNMAAADDAEASREQAQKLRQEAADAAGVSVEELVAKSSDGTIYDDEVEAPKENVSNAMKERLRREASAGLDSNKSQTNVILYISAAVALLVLAGGQGILY